MEIFNPMISNALQIAERRVANTLELLAGGATIPFIARYRKEMTGSCDDQKLRDINDRLTYLRNLEKRKEEVLSSIEEQGKLTEEIADAVAAAQAGDEIVLLANATVEGTLAILAGVTIGRGCTVGACSLVNKSTPPYCVIAGVPAKPIKFKWTIDEILEHEKALYPENERYTREELEKIFAETKTKLQ